MRERSFEVRLCAHLEASGDLVARQLGAGVARPGNRVVDVLRVDPGQGFEARRRLTDAAIPELAIAADVGAGRARPAAEAVRALEVHPRRARAALDRAVDVGFLEAERRGGRTFVRQVARYPDWFAGLTAIENKPDLDAPGDLDRQLRTDVALAVVDRVVLATASHVTRAHLHRWPDEVGVWRFHPGTGDLEVVREPARLAVDGPGIELLARRPGRDVVRLVDAESKARARRRLAERAYGKGWRPGPPVGCGHADVVDVAGVGLPACDRYSRLVEPARDCGPDCPAFVPGDAPAYDPRELRDRHSPWVADPDGLFRRQASLERYAERPRRG
ncbi:MAG: DUF5787 family protein [Halobacteriales archaeon]